MKDYSHISIEDYVGIDRQMADIRRQLTDNKMPLDPAWVSKKLTEIIASRPLTRPLGDIYTELEALSGKEIIINSKIFREIDFSFKKYGLTEPELPRPKTCIAVHEVIYKGDAQIAFSAISPDLDDLVMSQHQIIEYCKGSLQFAGGTLTAYFLIKKDVKYYVVAVENRNGVMMADVYPLEDLMLKGSERIIAPKAGTMLRVIAGSQQLKALDGTRRICDAKSTFSYIDRELSKIAHKVGFATPEIPTQIYKLMVGGTLRKTFQALPGTWDQKWLSQDQIIEFCEAYPDYLIKKGTNFFLAKIDESRSVDERRPEDNLIAVHVHVRPDGLHVYVSRLEYDLVLHGVYRGHVVSPQLLTT